MSIYELFITESIITLLITFSKITNLQNCITIVYIKAIPETWYCIKSMKRKGSRYQINTKDMYRQIHIYVLITNSK